MKGTLIRDHGVRAGCRAALFVACLVFSWTTQAQTTGSAASAKSTAPATLDTIVVTGVVPGPRLWKVEKDGRVMWILGVTQPLPRHLEWDSGYVEALVAKSQQVIKLPGMAVGANVGFWGRIGLIPAMMGIKKLPDGKRLKDVLPADLYTRWEAQKTRYLGDSQGIERLRPMFAGKELYAAAVRQSRLSDADGIEDRVVAFAKTARVPIADPTYAALMKNPKEDAKLFKASSVGGERCLGGILDALDHDMVQATARANAWATGDLAALEGVLAAPQQDACVSELADTDVARKLGIDDIEVRMRDRWLKYAENALAHNATTFALLPMRDLLVDKTYLGALRAAGYAVTAPGQLPEHTKPSSQDAPQASGGADNREHPVP